MKTNQRYESRIVKNAARQLARFLVRSKGLPSGWVEKSMSEGVRKHLSFMFRRQYLNSWKLDTVHKRVVVEAQRLVLQKFKKESRKSKPDTKTIQESIGFHGPLATSFYHGDHLVSFDSVGEILIDNVYMDIASLVPIPFQVCAKHTDGTTRVVSSGEIPARARMADQLSLRLTCPGFFHTDTNTRYFLRLNGGLVSSVVRPHFYRIREALRETVGDACGVSVTLTMKIGKSKFLNKMANSSAIGCHDEPMLAKLWVEHLMKNM